MKRTMLQYFSVKQGIQGKINFLGFGLLLAVIGRFALIKAGLL